MELRFAPEEEVAPKLLLGEYNKRFISSSQDLSCWMEEEGVCLGGVNAFRLDTLLMIDRLWVSDGHRGKGLGARLLTAVEERARGEGVKIVELNTFGFQAPGFYEKMGYRLFGSLEPAVGEWGHYFYTKEL
jgi:GNAT superfamily N-acetyltransferase